MATVEIRDKLTDEQLGAYPCDAEVTIHGWLCAHVPGYEPRPVPPLSVELNGNIVFQKKWPEVVIKPRDKLIIYPEPAAGLGAIIVKVLVSAAINYAISSIINKQADNSAKTTPEGSSIYSVNIQGNSQRLNGTIPEIMGMHKYYPDIISQPRRQYENNDEWLYLCLSAGVGEYTFHAKNIGETSILGYLGDIQDATYLPGADLSGDEAARNIYTSLEVDGFEIEGGAYADTNIVMPDGLRYSFNGNTISAEVSDGLDPETWSPATWPYAVNDLIQIESTPYNYGYYKVVSVASGGLSVKTESGDAVSFVDTSEVSAVIGGVTPTIEGEYIGPFNACPSSTTTNKIFVDLLYVGLGKVNDDGGISARTLDVDIEWREVGGDTWNVVSISKTASTLDELGDTHEIDLGADMVPEVRLRRMTEDSKDVSVRDEARWMRLKAELPGTIDNSDITAITLKIRGTNALSNAALTRFNTIQTRHLPVYSDGEWQPAAATRSISAAFAYIIKDCGHPDERIALAELEELHDIWEARGDTFDAVFDEASTLYESIKRVLAVGFSQPVISGGQILALREAATSDYGQFFSADNTISITEDGTLFDADAKEGVTVEYFSSETWLPEYIDCLLPGQDGSNTESIRAFGIIDKTKAYQYGMRYVRAKEYGRVQFTLETELEALNANLLDKCSVPSRDTQSGWCEAYDADTNLLMLSTELDWTDGEQHYIGVRRPDGTLSGVYECSRADSHSVLLAEVLDFEPEFDGPADPPLFKFGLADDWHRPVRIRTIDPRTDGKSTVIASIYDERVFLDDDSVPA